MQLGFQVAGLRLWPAAVALILPLAWELPPAVGAALKSKKKKKKKKNCKILSTSKCKFKLRSNLLHHLPPFLASVDKENIPLVDQVCFRSGL